MTPLQKIREALEDIWSCRHASGVEDSAGLQRACLTAQEALQLLDQMKPWPQYLILSLDNERYETRARCLKTMNVVRFDQFVACQWNWDDADKLVGAVVELEEPYETEVGNWLCHSMRVLTAHAMPEMCVEMPSDKEISEWVVSISAKHDLNQRDLIGQFMYWLRSRITTRTVESVKAEYESSVSEIVTKFNNTALKLDAERARSAKLVEALRGIRYSCTNPCGVNDRMIRDAVDEEAAQALKEYEQGETK